MLCVGTTTVCNRDAVFVNPGSISLARDRSGGTFAIVTYDNGQFDVEFVYKQDIVQLYGESFVCETFKRNSKSMHGKGYDISWIHQLKQSLK